MTLHDKISRLAPFLDFEFLIVSDCFFFVLFSDKNDYFDTFMLLLLYVLFEPGLNTPRITQVWMRRLHVHLFSITPPYRQMHSGFRAFYLLFPEDEGCYTKTYQGFR